MQLSGLDLTAFSTQCRLIAHLGSQFITYIYTFDEVYNIFVS